MTLEKFLKHNQRLIAQVRGRRELRDQADHAVQVHALACRPYSLLPACRPCQDLRRMQRLQQSEYDMVYGELLAAYVRARLLVTWSTVCIEAGIYGPE